MGNPIITSDDLVDFDLDAYPIWTCTNRLRWKHIEFEGANGLRSTIKLQQLWEYSNGNTEWRNVEFVS